MNTKEDIWNHSYYIITKTILRVIGHWPDQSRKETILCRALMYFFYTIQIGPQVAAIIYHYDDTGLLMEATSSFTTDIAVFMNVATFYVNADKMKTLLRSMEEDWRIFPENNGLRILHQNTLMGRKFSSMYAGSLYFAGLVFITEPVHLRIARLFIKSNDTIPLTFAIPVEYGPIDIEKYYRTILITSGICILAVVTTVIAGDVALFMYTHHACGVFEALGFAIENLPVEERCGKDDEYEYQYLKSCIKIHHRAIEFSDTIEDIYTWNFLGIAGNDLFAISITAVQVVTNQGAVEKLFKTILFVMAKIFHLFVQCFMAQRLVDESLNLNQCLMNTRWYFSSPRTKTLIKFMSMRSQSPCQLTAGKVAFMCLDTFAMIIKTSASYFTVFLNMQ